MLEDKLSRGERIRLECLSQVNMTSIGRTATAEQTIQKAALFEDYIKKGRGTTDAANSE